MKRFRCLLIMVLLVLDQGVASAGGLRNFSDSWPIASSTARRLLLDSIKLRPVPRGLMVMAGHGRLFEMAELNQSFLAFEGKISPRTIPMHLSGQWERLGSGLFVEDHLEFRILLGESPSWGISTHWFAQRLGDNDEEPILEFRLLWQMAFSFREIRGRFHLEWPLKQNADSPGASGRRNVFKLTMATDELAAALVVDRREDGTPKPGFHILLAVEHGVGLEFRADPATGSLGPGLSVVRGGLMFRTSHVVHPHLGVTHRLLLVVGKFGDGR